MIWKFSNRACQHVRSTTSKEKLESNIDLSDMELNDDIGFEDVVSTKGIKQECRTMVACIVVLVALSLNNV